MKRLPLSALLSQALVAFTIEFDNEFERRMPHRTTRHGSAAGPWLVSMVMWSTCMRFAGDDGVTLAELEDLARTPTNLNGMQRWGYVTVEPRPGASPLIRATSKGRMAREVWRTLFGEIEARWQTRFGKDEMGRLRESLSALIGRIDLDLPDCLPILGYGLVSRAPNSRPSREQGSASSLPLPALLSKALLAFAIEFERESDASLAIAENVVRVLDEKGVRVRDLPLLTGVSKEAIAMAMGFLEKRGFAVVGPDPSASRTKLARLTPKGQAAKDDSRRLLATVEQRWEARYGKDTVRAVRESLEPLVGEATAESSPLFQGLEPHPEGWRASVRKPQTLPYFPMVLHRGGFPDGS